MAFFGSVIRFKAKASLGVASKIPHISPESAMMLANGMIPAARNAGDGTVKESKDRNAKAQRLR